MNFDVDEDYHADPVPKQSGFVSRNKGKIAIGVLGGIGAGIVAFNKKFRDGSDPEEVSDIGTPDQDPEPVEEIPEVEETVGTGSQHMDLNTGEDEVEEDLEELDELELNE